MGFWVGTLERQICFQKSYKSPIPKRRKLLARCLVFIGKRALLKNPFELDRANSSTPEKHTLKMEFL